MKVAGNVLGLPDLNRRETWLQYGTARLLCCVPSSLPFREPHFSLPHRMYGHDGRQVIKLVEDSRVELIKVVVDGGLDDADGVVGALVEVPAYLLVNVVRDVVLGGTRDDLGGRCDYF